MSKKAQITLTTDDQLKKRDTFYFNRMGLSLSGAIKTFLYKVYYNHGQMPYQLNGGINRPKADSNQDLIKYGKAIDNGDLGKKHHYKK